MESIKKIIYWPLHLKDVHVSKKKDDDDLWEFLSSSHAMFTYHIYVNKQKMQNKTKQNGRRIELKRNICGRVWNYFFYYVCVQIWLDSVALCIYRRYSKKKCGSNRIFLSSFFSLAFLVSVAYFLLSSPMQQKQIQIFFLHIQHTRHKNSTALVARGCDGMSEI